MSHGPRQAQVRVGDLKRGLAQGHAQGRTLSRRASTQLHKGSTLGPGAGTPGLKTARQHALSRDAGSVAAAQPLQT